MRVATPLQSATRPHVLKHVSRIADKSWLKSTAEVWHLWEGTGLLLVLETADREVVVFPMEAVMVIGSIVWRAEHSEIAGGDCHADLSYEEFTRLAETRLAQSTFSYLKIAYITLN